MEENQTLQDARCRVAKSVRDSFAIIRRRDPQFQKSYESHLTSSEKSLNEITFNKSLTFRPIIYGENPNLCCAQEHVFGFYVLQQMMRSLFMSINHVHAGDTLLTTGLHASSTICHYAAAYHALHAFLSSIGRVFLDSVVNERNPLGISDEGKKSIIAVQSKHKKWSFECRSKTHKTHWREIDNVFGKCPEHLPHYFHDLFKHIFHGEYRVGGSILDRINDPEKYMISIDDKFKEFLKRIPNMRHVAQYHTMGSDPFLIEMVMNGDAISENGIEGQATCIGDFSAAMLEDSARFLKTVCDGLEMRQSVHKALCLTSSIPYFDEPKLDGLKRVELAETVSELLSWLRKPLKR
jgi:hypothetical protein